MPKRRIGKGECGHGPMVWSIIRDVRGKWSRIYWPKHKACKQVKRF